MKNKHLLTFVCFTVMLSAACKKDKAHETDFTQCETLSYEEEIAPLITTNCNNIDCHGANQQPVLTYYAAVKASVDNGSFANEITIDPTIPEGHSISEKDFDSFHCWLNDGAPKSKN